MSTPEKIKLENSQSFEVTTGNKKYNLIISYNDKLMCFEIEKVDEFPKKEYYLYLNMEQLSKINRFFIQFNSISEVLDSLKFIIQNNNLSIIEEGNDIKMQIINPFSKNSFDVNIPLKEKNLKEEMSSITNYIVTVKNELEEKIKEENQKVKLLEENIKLLEKKVDELMSIKKDYEKAKIEEIKKENRYFSNSNIIKFEDENMIMNWFDKKPIRFSKLFDSKERGDNIKIFYDLCKHKPPLIVFIKTLNGYRFGWFTGVEFPNNDCKSSFYDSQYYYVSDKKAFIFSVDKKEKYDDKEYGSSLHYYYDNKYNNDDYGYSYPRYFEFSSPKSIKIYDKCTMHCKNSVSSDINGGQNYFIAESYEAYQLDY